MGLVNRASRKKPNQDRSLEAAKAETKRQIITYPSTRKANTISMPRDYNP